MSVRPEELRHLLALLDATKGTEIDCTEFLHQATPFLERWAADGAMPSGFEDVAQHLRVCPECLEEVETLLTLLADDTI